MLELGAVPEAAPCARTLAKVMLLAWGLPELSESVELLITELVSNAIRVTRELTDPVRPPIRLRLSLSGTGVLVEVWDASPRLPVLKEPDYLAERGRGLHLVETLSNKWGYYHTKPNGKVVWCFIEIPG
jgi:anti-sigma regulatory factor (Ser/Thr protein kinase)